MHCVLAMELLLTLLDQQQPEQFIRISIILDGFELESVVPNRDENIDPDSFHRRSSLLGMEAVFFAEQRGFRKLFGWAFRAQGTGPCPEGQRFLIPLDECGLFE
jgi:hypothetical protein